MPLHRRYRAQLDSTVADMKNLGYGEGGAITAALFLAEFVGDMPWAHIDIAGTAQRDGGHGHGARRVPASVRGCWPSSRDFGGMTGRASTHDRTEARGRAGTACWTSSAASGNKVPHPVLMFLYLIIGVIVISVESSSCSTSASPSRSRSRCRT